MDDAGQTEFVTDREIYRRVILEQFDQVWMGARCDACRRKAFCADFKEIARGSG